MMGDPLLVLDPSQQLSGHGLIALPDRRDRFGPVIRDPCALAVKMLPGGHITVGDFHQFKNGAQFGAWLGLTPRQNSSGGKSSLGGITKRGDMYLRMLLIQGAKSAVMTAHMRDDPISKWLCQLREKSGWQKAAVAMANKNARILWAMMTKGCRFDSRHVSVKPAGAMAMALAVTA